MMYKEVKRNAKNGEFVKVVNPDSSSVRQGVSIGEVFKVFNVEDDIAETSFYDSTRTSIQLYDYEYVVLEECKDDLSEYTTEQLQAEIEERAKPKYYSGKVICSKAITKCFTKGKLYEIANGVLINNFGYAQEKILSMNSLNFRMMDDFIEYVE